LQGPAGSWHLLGLSKYTCKNGLLGNFCYFFSKNDDFDLIP